MGFSLFFGLLNIDTFCNSVSSFAFGENMKWHCQEAGWNIIIFSGSIYFHKQSQ